jgi:hypothetical protein
MPTVSLVNNEITQTIVNKAQQAKCYMRGSPYSRYDFKYLLFISINKLAQPLPSISIMPCNALE